MPAIAEPPKPSPTPAPAPSPTPAPPAPPSPTPSPAPAPSGKTAGEAFDDQFAHLDDAPAPAPKPAAPAKPDPSKPVVPAKPDAKPEPKKEPAPEPDKEPEAPDAEPPAVAKPSELRSYAKRMGEMAKNATKENKALRARIAEIEAAPKQNGHDSAALAEQLAAANKRIAELDGTLKLTKYERSNEFKEKYEIPYQNAYKKAYRDTKELLVTVREPNPDDPDHPIERERQAVESDFDAVFNQPLGQATKLAKQMFGDAYQTVLSHRQKIRELQEAADADIKAYREKGAEHENQESARTKQEQQFAMIAYDKARASIKAKYPDFMDERPDDAEGNDLLHKGTEFADLAFDSEQLDKYTLPQQVAIHARVAAWAGAFPRMRRDISVLRAQLAEAEKTISDLRGSGPGKPAPAAETAPQAPKDLMAAFDERIK